MRKHVLVLLACLALISSAQLMAQEPATPAPTKGAEAPVPDLGQALLTPSCEQPETPNLQVPAPQFMTGCSTNADCPTGQICCFLCGAFPDGDPSLCMGCVQPTRKGCPLVV